MLRRLGKGAAIAAVAMAGVALGAAPAHAADTGAYKDNFNGRGCDALVYVSDTTSSGKVEAFGGFNCAQSVRLIGTAVVTLIRDSKEVCHKTVNYSLVSTIDAACAVSDPGGNQKWYAKLRLVTSDTTGGVMLTTGKITS